MGSPSQAASQDCTTHIISHATAEKIAPENTIPGIDAAANVQHVDTVEMDMRYVKSNYAYLLHDPTLDRTTTGTGNIADKGVGDMGPISAVDYAPWNTNPLYTGTLTNGHAKTEVPFVTAFLQEIKTDDVDALLDAKVTPTKAQADLFMGYVNRSDLNLSDRLLYMGDATNISTMHGWYPQLTYGLIEYPPTGRIYDPSYLKSIGATFYAVPQQYLEALGGKDFVSYMHSGGIQVYTWTSDTDVIDVSSNWQQAFDDGVDSLITNYPIEARQLCGA